MAGNESLKDRAYNIIKQRIINLEFPPEQFFSESELVELIGVSRTPIREALVRLEQEKYIQVVPHKGVFVKSIMPGDVNGLFELRSVLETHLIRTRHHKLDKGELAALGERMEQALAVRDWTAQFELDNALHLMIFHTSNNPYIEMVMNMVYEQNHRIRVLSGANSEERMIQSYHEHSEVIRHLLNDEIEQAAQAMAHHLEEAKKVAFARIF